MTDFLPKAYDKNERLNETGSNYMKFEKGENKFRVLGSAIVGWEWWEDTKEGGRTPKRVKIDQKIDVSSVEDPSTIKRFWAFPVWNYKLNKIQILEITQKRIQSVLKGLVDSQDWGSPVNYDITIFRKGETKEDTSYEVIPSPPKKLSDEVSRQYKNTYIELEKLYEGGDPFEDDGKNISQADIDKIEDVFGKSN